MWNQREPILRTARTVDKYREGRLKEGGTGCLVDSTSSNRIIGKMNNLTSSWRPIFLPWSPPTPTPPHCSFPSTVCLSLKTSTVHSACSNTVIELVQSCNSSLCSVMHTLHCDLESSLWPAVTHQPPLVPSSLSNKAEIPQWNPVGISLSHEQRLLCSRIENLE